MSELPEHVRRNRAMWDEWAKKYATPRVSARGRRRSRPGVFLRLRNPKCGCFPMTSPEKTSSSSDAAPPMFRRG